MVRPRVFVSSVVDGFEEYRAAARRGIERAGCDPVMVNEDFPAVPASPRNACLDAVDSADLFVLLIGLRGGFRAPSGKLVVEEEYEQAEKRHLPTLTFLQKGPRDADAEALAVRLGAYVEGHFRVEFDSTQELEVAVHAGLSQLVSMYRVPMTEPTTVDRLLKAPPWLQGDPSLRLVVVPERQDELVDPVTLGSNSFARLVQRLGHDSDPPLLDYSEGKRTDLARDMLTITQGSDHGYRSDGRAVRLSLGRAGQLVVDATISGPIVGDRDTAFIWAAVVDTRHIEAVLRQAFAMYSALLRELDPYARHQRFLYNVVLLGLEHRRLEHNPTPRQSYTMSPRNLSEPVVAYDAPRLIGRATVAAPSAEIERVVTLLTRIANAS